MGEAREAIPDLAEIGVDARVLDRAVVARELLGRLRCWSMEISCDSDISIRVCSPVTGSTAQPSRADAPTDAVSSQRKSRRSIRRWKIRSARSLDMTAPRVARNL